nr:MAG TPA: distal tail protein [Caudoviricetes sp.]
MRDESYFSIIFGEGAEAVDIGKLFDAVTKVERNAGAGQEHTYSAGVGRYGKTWVSGHRASYPITIEAIKIGSAVEFLALRTKLAKALDCPNGPKKLQFDDQDGAYYMAVTSGQVKFSEDIHNSKVAVSIAFDVPDGLLHSEVTKLLDANTTTSDIGSITKDGKTVKITLNNAGSAPAYPIIRVRNNADNGWIGLVNKNGIMEIGTNNADLDGTRIGTGQFNQSQTLVDIKPTDQNEWAKFKNVSSQYRNISPLPFASHGEISNLEMGWRQKGLGGLAYDAPGFYWNGKGDKGVGRDWGSCIYEYVLPNDKSGVKGSPNWRCDFNIKVWASKFGQTGALSILFVTDDNKVICAYTIEKPDASGEITWQSFSLGDIHSGATYTREMNSFGSNNNEPGTPRPNVGFNSKTGDAYVIKEGPKFTYSYNGVPKTVNDSAKEHLVCTKIWIMAGRYKGERSDIGYLDTLGIQSIRFTKNNTERYDLVPNKYVKGSEVVADMEQGKIFFVPNPSASKVGVSAAGDLINGSRYFSIPPGESKLEVHSSEFCTEAPDVTIEWNEAWL